MDNVCVPVRHREAKSLSDWLTAAVVSFVLDIEVLEPETRMFPLDVSLAPPDVSVV
jgi:hypothetical protein